MHAFCAINAHAKTGVLTIACNAAVYALMQDKKPIERNLQQQARQAQWLVLWLDCDREGENIAFEVLGPLPSCSAAQGEGMPELVCVCRPRTGENSIHEHAIKHVGQLRVPSRVAAHDSEKVENAAEAASHCACMRMCAKQGACMALLRMHAWSTSP